MKYSFHPDAQMELNAQIVYYEECRANLGVEFAAEIYKTIQRILEFPDAWQLLSGDIRRCLVNRFPFGVLYYQRRDEIIILAVMQLNKKPDYWVDRV